VKRYLTLSEVTEIFGINRCYKAREGKAVEVNCRGSEVRRLIPGSES
jgi:hypothetical protein